ncbi:two-component sensor histidine kinase [[Synechococcus] sp. NIES-970]|nr:two-component sensor histidine kinase [[Synechococcus] sp. NIES-970]
MNLDFEQLDIQQTVVGILQKFQPLSSPAGDRHQGDQWGAAIVALTELLQATTAASHHGIILSSPSPLFAAPQIATRYHHCVLTPKNLRHIARDQLQLPGGGCPQGRSLENKMVEFPLLPNDPLAQEQFCVILTEDFNFAMAASPQGLLFSFEPEAIAAIWEILQWRLALTQPFQYQALARRWQPLGGQIPDYRLVVRFSQLFVRSLVATLPQTDIILPEESLNIPEQTVQAVQPELELLQALTHEIRTPLTTIRTMTKLLLKKKTQLTKDIVKRIETIEQECNEQIRRMELIFRAAELETPSQKQRHSVQLMPISLEQLFQEGTPRWQKQAQRRNVNLEVTLPPYLPQVVSDPAMLDQVLSGLIETFTRRLPTGAEVQIQVSTAGDQLKLEVQSHGLGQKCLEKAIGQLLVFQPETGSLSLNPNVTKNLFQQLGGKLAIRRRASGEEVFAIFLPLGHSLAVPI